MKTLVLFLLLSCPLLLKAQISHVVQCGESFSLIASRYGISEEQLHKANPLCDECHVGMSLTILQSDIELANNNKERQKHKENVILMQKEYDDAILLTASGEYKKAVKKYDLLIEKNPIAELYMMRGLCQYEREKWKRSIEDFEQALVLGGLSDKERLQTEEYLKKAREYRNIQLNNRAKAWAEFATMAVASTAVAVQASIMQKEASKRSGTSTIRQDTSSDTAGEREYDRDDSSTTSSNSSKGTCKKCIGKGTCLKCNGDGHYFDNSFGIAREVECTYCNGTGKCSACSGTGRK